MLKVDIVSAFPRRFIRVSSRTIAIEFCATQFFSDFYRSEYFETI